jgi:hypothetical protein
MPGEILGWQRMEKEGESSEVADLLKKNCSKWAAVGIGGARIGRYERICRKWDPSAVHYCPVSLFERFFPRGSSRIDKNFSGPHISAEKASLTSPGYFGIHLGELIAVFPE